MLNSSVGASIYNSSRDDSMISTQNKIAFNEARIGSSRITTSTSATDLGLGGGCREEQLEVADLVAGLEPPQGDVVGLALEDAQSTAGWAASRAGA